MVNNIRKLREGRDLTLEQLSKLVFIDDSVLSRMENSAKQISENYAIILADFFDVSLDYLFGRKISKIYQVDRKDILKNLTPQEVILELNRFATVDLIKINGVIDYILNNRTEDKNLNLEIKDISKVKSNS